MKTEMIGWRRNKNETFSWEAVWEAWPNFENICLDVQEINAGEERFREEAVRGCGALGHGPKSDAKC